MNIFTTRKTQANWSLLTNDTESHWANTHKLFQSNSRDLKPGDRVFFYKDESRMAKEGQISNIEGERAFVKHAYNEFNVPLRSIFPREFISKRDKDAIIISCSPPSWRKYCSYFTRNDFIPRVYKLNFQVVVFHQLALKQFMEKY